MFLMIWLVARNGESGKLSMMYVYTNFICGFEYTNVCGSAYLCGCIVNGIIAMTAF